MAPDLDLLARRLATQPAVLVSVESTQGSAPREQGTWMAVWPGPVPNTLGTIGGGQLEWQAIARAQRILQGQEQAGLQRYALGPSLGQCCGGVMVLRYELVSAADLPGLRQRLACPRVPVALFGGGHVGQALVEVLSHLPFALTWIDSRDGIFPTHLFDEWPSHVKTEHSDPVYRAVADLPAQARVLIMSFSHAEDLDVVAACLQRQRARADLPYVGLIGSHSKWASFRQRLMQQGFTEAELAHVTCPIGLPGIVGKAPEVIAVSVAAQLLLVTS